MALGIFQVVEQHIYMNGMVLLIMKQSFLQVMVTILNFMELVLQLMIQFLLLHH